MTEEGFRMNRQIHRYGTEAWRDLVSSGVHEVTAATASAASPQSPTASGATHALALADALPVPAGQR